MNYGMQKRRHILFMPQLAERHQILKGSLFVISGQRRLNLICRKRIDSPRPFFVVAIKEDHGTDGCCICNHSILIRRPFLPKRLRFPPICFHRTDLQRRWHNFILRKSVTYEFYSYTTQQACCLSNCRRTKTRHSNPKPC